MKLKKFRIRYTDVYDLGCPVFSTTVLAYDREHAEEEFFDTPDQGWKIVSIKKVRSPR